MKYLERQPGRAVTFGVQERQLAARDGGESCKPEGLRAGCAQQLLAHEGSVPDDQTLLSFMAGPFSNPIVSAFRETLTSWSIFHDLHVDQEAELRKPAVSRIEKRVASNGQNLIPVLHTLYTTERDFKKNVDMAMRAAFGDDFEELSFPPAADQRVQLRLRWRSLKNEQSASDLSDGTVRFLLLLAILGNPEPDTLIAIDEPELGLHPAMLPIVGELARQAASRSQVILTTHSPQLLEAFGAEPPTTTVARWENGETKLFTIEGAEMSCWVEQYSLGELFRSGEGAAPAALGTLGSGNLVSTA